MSGFSVFPSDAPQPLTKLAVAMATTEDNDTTRQQLVATCHPFIVLSHPKILDMYSKPPEPNSSGPIGVISVLGRKSGAAFLARVSCFGARADFSHRQREARARARGVG